MNVGHTGPWHEELVNDWRRRNPGGFAFTWPQGRPCPGMGRSLCAEAVGAIARPLQDILGWRRPEYPTIASVIEERDKRRAARRAALPPTPQVIPSPKVQLVYAIPPSGTYACQKNSAFNQVDCYVIATGQVFWSNWQVGPWCGQEAPPGAPFNSGIGKC